MKRFWLLPAVSAALLGLTGCQTPLPPGAERGPDGTMAYDVLIEASPPGAKIEANGEIVGETPVTLKIFGDKDGTFHDFGSDFYVIRALSVSTNQYPQVRMFGTGRWFGPEDRIPQHIYFDMNQRQPDYPPGAVIYPYAYPGPYYYPAPYYYYGPSFGFYYGPRYHYYHDHHREGLRYRRP
jgi:hypothetical protein